MESATIEKTLGVIPSFFRMRLPHAWFDYDRDADVLYVSFEKPQHATDSEMTSENIIVRKRDKKIVGLTVLHASRFE